MKGIKKFFLTVFLGTAIIACKNSNDKNAESAKEAVAENTPEIPADNSVQEEGAAIYKQYCVTCHQANGGGVPNLNPPLKQTQYVLGDKERLIGILLNGSSEGLEIKGKVYSNNMPAFDYLNDQQIAHVLTYVRSNFGNDAEAVKPGEVQAMREKN